LIGIKRSIANIPTIIILEVAEYRIQYAIFFSFISVFIGFYFIEKNSKLQVEAAPLQTPAKSGIVFPYFFRF